LLISVRDTESVPIVKNYLAHKIDKSFALDRMKLPRLLAIARQLDLMSPRGIFLRKDFAFDFDKPVMHVFVERMSRCLVRAEFGLEYFEANVDWRLNVEQPTTVYQGMAEFGRWRAVHDVFIYLSRGPKDDEPIWVIIIFARVKPANRV
jgi:hypothetical protein